MDKKKNHTRAYTNHCKINSFPFRIGKYGIDRLEEKLYFKNCYYELTLNGKI